MINDPEFYRQKGITIQELVKGWVCPSASNSIKTLYEVSGDLQMLANEITRLQANLNKAMEAVDHYADKGRWSLVAVPEFSCSKYLRYEYFESHGFGFARKVRDEIEGMK